VSAFIATQAHLQYKYLLLRELMMTSRDFVFWLQGMFELGKFESLNKEQTRIIRKHLNLVFIHDIDPSMGDEEIQAKLNEAHDQVKQYVPKKKRTITPPQKNIPVPFLS
jgi:hypothetical protein